MDQQEKLELAENIRKSRERIIELIEEELKFDWWMYIKIVMVLIVYLGFILSLLAFGIAVSRM